MAQYFNQNFSYSLKTRKDHILQFQRSLQGPLFTHDSCQSIVKSGDSIKMHNALLLNKQKESFGAWGSSIKFCVTD